MKRDLLSTVRVYCLSIMATSPTVSFIIVLHIYIPALETCTSLITRSNDNIKSTIPLAVDPSILLRRIKFGSVHTSCATVTSIVIFTIHETVISEPIRSVLEEGASIETANKNQKFDAY